jgi:hypothetical protein
MPRTRNKFIGGLFNYCERWCERRDHAGRRRVAGTEQRRLARRSPKGQDASDTGLALRDAASDFGRARRDQIIELLRLADGLLRSREEPIAGCLAFVWPPNDEPAEDARTCWLIRGMHHA